MSIVTHRCFTHRIQFCSTIKKQPKEESEIELLQTGRISPELKNDTNRVCVDEIKTNDIPANQLQSLADLPQAVQLQLQPLSEEHKCVSTQQCCAASSEINDLKKQIVRHISRLIENQANPLAIVIVSI
jgi:hypothetical protein